MDEPIRVAVVIPCFDDGQWVEAAYCSATDVAGEVRDVAALRCVLVDDGSSDRRTLDVLDRLHRSGAELVRIAHSGLAAARNSGIAYARCPYFVPLDSDNLLRPEMIRAGLPLLREHGDAAMAYGDAMWFGDKAGRWVMGPTDVSRLRVMNHIDNCALVRTSAWEAVGRYQSAQLGHEDWLLWGAFLARGFTLRYTGVVSFDYRVRAGSLIERAGGLRYRPDTANRR